MYVSLCREHSRRYGIPSAAGSTTTSCTSSTTLRTDAGIFRSCLPPATSIPLRGRPLMSLHGQLILSHLPLSCPLHCSPTPFTRFLPNLSLFSPIHPILLHAPYLAPSTAILRIHRYLAPSTPILPYSSLSCPIQPNPVTSTPVLPHPPLFLPQTPLSCPIHRYLAPFIAILLHPIYPVPSTAPPLFFPSCCVMPLSTPILPHPPYPAPSTAILPKDVGA